MTNVLKKHSKMLTLGRTLRKEENGQDSSHGQLQRSPMDPLVIRSSFGKILLKIKMTMRMVPTELDNLHPHTYKKSHKMTRVRIRKQTLTILPLVQLIDMRTVTFCKYTL